MDSWEKSDENTLSSKEITILLFLYKEITVVNNHGDIVSFDGVNATDSFNFKTKITGQTNNDGIINVEIMVPLKYLSNF